MSSKRDQWTFRLKQHLRFSTSAYFVTLTYDDTKVPVEEVLPEVYLPVVHKRDVQLFVKRLRKASQGKIKYYLVSEYGSNTYRPHYHAIMFNVDENSTIAAQMISQAWSYGFIYLGKVTEASIHYVTKYQINKTDFPNEAVKPFALISKGLGLDYVEKSGSFHKGNIDHFYTRNEGGILGPLPRYYYERLYTPEERKKRAEIASNLKVKPFKGNTNKAKAFTQWREYYESEMIKKTKSKKV